MISTVNLKSSPKIPTRLGSYRWEPETLIWWESVYGTTNPTDNLYSYDLFIKNLKLRAFNEPLSIGELNLFEGVNSMNSLLIHCAPEKDLAIVNINQLHQFNEANDVVFFNGLGIRSSGNSGLITNVGTSGKFWTDLGLLFGQVIIGNTDTGTAVFGLGGVDNVNRGAHIIYGATTTVQVKEGVTHSSALYSGISRHVTAWRYNSTATSGGETWINGNFIATTASSAASRGGAIVGICGRADTTNAFPYLEGFYTVNAIALTYGFKNGASVNIPELNNVIKEFLQDIGITNLW
jgi:hypothetical protein